MVAKPRNRYTIKQKKEIVAEAYGIRHNIRKTAQKYFIQAHQIRDWSTIFNDEDIEIPVYPEHRTAAERAIVCCEKNNLTRHKGAESKISNATYDAMMIHYDDLRLRGLPVSAKMLSIECIRLDPELAAVGLHNLRRRVMRYLIAHNITHRVVTHKAQNCRYYDEIIRDWTFYINAQIQAGKYESRFIVNCDETNIDFDPTHRSTLERVGTRSVNLKCNGSPGRCTVMLAVSGSGVKLAPLVIFKGSPRGRIIRELLGDDYNHNNMHYTVQEKAWMNTRTYHLWITQVLVPYFAAQRLIGDGYGYLLQDICTVHCTHENIVALSDAGIQCDYIPAGYTGILQVMDKGVNKPFKQFIRQESLQWLISQPPNTKPTRQIIAQWIHAAWEQVTVDTIVNTWATVGIVPCIAI